ncbi:hypothetical protein Dimus_000946, partial [Dionaea muscipula]
MARANSSSWDSSVRMPRSRTHGTRQFAWRKLVRLALVRPRGAGSSGWHSRDVGTCVSVWHSSVRMARAHSSSWDSSVRMAQARTHGTRWHSFVRVALVWRWLIWVALAWYSRSTGW